MQRCSANSTATLSQSKSGCLCEEYKIADAMVPLVSEFSISMYKSVAFVKLRDQGIPGDVKDIRKLPNHFISMLS